MRERLKPPKYLKTIVVLITTMVITFIVITAISITGFIQKRMMEERYASDMNTLSQIKKTIERNNQFIRSICMELYYSDNSRSIMLNAWGENDPLLRSKLNRVSSTTLELNPFIHSLYFYNPNMRTYYTAESLERMAVNDVYLANLMSMNTTNAAPAFQPMLRLIDTSHGDTYTTEKVFTYIMSNTLTGYYNADPIIVINVHPDFFLNEIKSVTVTDAQSDAAFFLFTKSGDWFVDTGKDYTGGDAFFDSMTSIFTSHIVPVFHQGESLGIITKEIQGADYLISFTGIGGTDLTLVKAQPYDIAFQDYHDLLSRVVFITILAVAAALPSSFLLAWNLYRPIRKLVNTVSNRRGQSVKLSGLNELDYLSDTYMSAFSQLQDIQTKYGLEPDIFKQNLGIRLLRGAATEEELRRAGKDGLTSVNLAAPFYLLVLYINNAAKLDKLSSREYSAYNYAVGNIMGEVLGSFCRYDFYELEPNCRYVLLSPKSPVDTDAFYALLGEAVGIGQQAISHHLGLHVGAAVSRKVEQPAGLPEQLELVNRNRKYRIVYGTMSLITPEMVARNNDSARYDYPLELEENLLKEVRSCNMRQAGKKLDRLIGKVLEMEYSAIILAIMRLNSAIGRTLAEMYRSRFLSVPEDTEALRANYLEHHTIADAQTLIWRKIHEAAEALKDIGAVANRPLVHQAINDMIEAEYGDPSFCLNTIAIALNMSPNYVNGLYKKATGESISQSILNFRLEKAAVLLVSTELSIAKIIESTGFLNESSFYRNFKRKFGSTPSNYKLHAKLYQKENPGQ